MLRSASFISSLDAAQEHRRNPVPEFPDTSPERQPRPFRASNTLQTHPVSSAARYAAHHPCTGIRVTLKNGSLLMKFSRSRLHDLIARFATGICRSSALIVTMVSLSWKRSLAYLPGMFWSILCAVMVVCDNIKFLLPIRCVPLPV